MRCMWHLVGCGSFSRPVRIRLLACTGIMTHHHFWLNKHKRPHKVLAFGPCRRRLLLLNERDRYTTYACCFGTDIGGVCAVAAF